MKEILEKNYQSDHQGKGKLTAISGVISEISLNNNKNNFACSYIKNCRKIDLFFMKLSSRMRTEVGNRTFVVPL